MSDTSVPGAHLIFAATAQRWFLLILAVVMPAAAGDLEVEARDLVARRCLGCHGPKSKVAGLDLSTRETALKGGSKGPARSSPERRTRAC
jgi:mono/diheme cytochrome c family protein